MNLAGMMYLNREWVLPPHALAMDLEKTPPRIKHLAAKRWHDRANSGKCTVEEAGTAADPRVIAANQETADFIAPFLDLNLPVSLDCNSSAEDIRGAAERLADKFREKELIGQDYQAMLRGAAAIGVQIEQAFAKQLKHIRQAVVDDEKNQQIGINAIKGRLKDPKWWRRWLNRKLFRQMESALRQSGMVHRRAGLYLSPESFARKEEQVRRNKAFFENMTAVCEATGEEFELSQLWEGSLANPKIRRMELMARLKGFDIIAQAHGHYGCLVTLTCPSRFHKMADRNGRPVANGKYDGSTPRDAAEYLSGVWAQIRASLGRNGVRIYGFRVAEPHHDGTPHWHILCMMEPEQAMLFKRTVARYGCRENREELGLSYYETDKERTAAAKIRQAALAEAGSRKISVEELKAKMTTESEYWAKQDFINWKGSRAAVRVDFEDLDRKKGSFVGYVAKYLSKNIDGQNNQGENIGDDYEADLGTAAAESAKRACAWASQWGIRQFQQIGGVPVTLYRELRRVESYREESDSLLHLACAAADKGDWGKFVALLGGADGAFVRRADIGLKLYKEEVAELNQYGEPKDEKIRGVIDIETGEFFVSRVKEWILKPGGSAAPWTCVNNCTISENAQNSAFSDGGNIKKPTTPEEIAETLAACEPFEPLGEQPELADETWDFNLFGYEGENTGSSRINPAQIRKIVAEAWAEAEAGRLKTAQKWAKQDYLARLNRMTRPLSGGIVPKQQSKELPGKHSARAAGYRAPQYDTPDKALRRLADLSEKIKRSMLETA